MKNSVLALLLLGSTLAAHATIGNGGLTPIPIDAKYANGRSVAGNPELFLSVYDSEAKLSYTLDLGLDMDSFWINAQQDAGSQWFKALDDENWSSFLGLVNKGNLRWTVLSADDAGGTLKGQKRLFMTVKQGGEKNIANWTNQQFTNAIGAGKFAPFISSVNQTGTHAVPQNDYQTNGSGIISGQDPVLKAGYFGGDRLNATLGATTSGFEVDNAVGQSSWFYYITRSGANQIEKVVVDEFDNLDHDAYWGFTYVDPAQHPQSPYAGKYLLSYTMQAAGIRATTAEGRLRMSLTDYLASTMPTRRIAAVGGEFAGYLPGSLVPSISPVPEPSSWALMGLGLAALTAWSRRRQRV